MLILLFFAFISGLVTILAPCIWPLLPIILSTSINGSRARSLGITLGIMVSFTILTLGVSFVISLFGVSADFLRIVASIILVVLGLTMIIPAFGRVVEGVVSRFASFAGSQPGAQRTGFGGGFITGLSLGVVWTPCAGPIFATIATAAATSNVSFGIILMTVVYVIGVGIPLFFFSYGGQKFAARTKFVNKYTGRIQQVFGVIILLTAIAIYTGYSTVLQAKLLDALPFYSNFLTSFEKNDAVKKELQKLKETKQQERSDGLLNLFEVAPSDEQLFNVQPVAAPEFVGITNWINSEPLTMQELRGKVVLIDFWTYTCINCIRTLPFVTSWYEKYKDQGFVVVGVHTPEFAFEKDTKNVENALAQFRKENISINYPVAQDNDYGTWNAYSNQYWPAEYLIDAEGKIRRVHFGEGKYDETEKAIQKLLEEAGKKVVEDMVQVKDQTPKGDQSPETYLGSLRMEYYFPSGNIQKGIHTLTLSDNIPEDRFSLGGTWTISDEYAMSGKGAALTYRFKGNNVFLVMNPPARLASESVAGGPASGIGKVKVYLDGKLIDEKDAGADVKNGEVTIDAHRLYTLVTLEGKKEVHTLKLEFVTPGVSAYAFTFG